MFVLKFQISPVNIWPRCCRMGMEAARIETKDELNCVYEAYKALNCNKYFLNYDMYNRK